MQASLAGEGVGGSLRKETFQIFLYFKINLCPEHSFLKVALKKTNYKTGNSVNIIYTFFKICALILRNRGHSKHLQMFINDSTEKFLA